MIYHLSIFSIIFWIMQAVYSLFIFLKFQQKLKWPTFFKCNRGACNNYCGRECLEKFTIHQCITFLKSKQELLLQLVVFIFVFIFCGASISHAATNTVMNKHLWRIGIFAIIFGWTYFIILGSKFPSLGEYSLIFISILKTFQSLAIFGLLLILASTLVLRMLFYNPLELASCLNRFVVGKLCMLPSFQNSPFSTFGGSVVKLITMVTGDLDFQDTFGFSFSVNETASRNLYDRSMAYFLWIIFLVLIPIVLSNMLVSWVIFYFY